MDRKKVIIIVRDSYLKFLINSVGSKIFKNLYAYVNGTKKDILENGGLSCAFYASSVLQHFKLISDVHATVSGTIKDLMESGWREIKRPVPGSIIVWEEKEFEDGSFHKHMGFYLEKNKAISNSTVKKVPAIHHWTFGQKNGQPIRKVEMILWNDKLERKKT